MNWEQARSQLRRSQLALEEALVPSRQHIDAVYRRRAVRLAAGERAVVAGLPVLVFCLAGGRYAIELKHLAEVLPLAGCTPVPGAPPQFLGVIHLRGEIRTVLDASRVLTPLEAGSKEAPGFVVMLRHQGREVGLRVDRVEGMREIQPAELTPSDHGNYVKGLTRDTLMLLNVEMLLAEVFSKEDS